MCHPESESPISQAVTSTRRELRQLDGHGGFVQCAALLPDGRRAVSGHADRIIRLWDLEMGRELCTLEGHADSVDGVAVTPNGLRAVSASWDKTLKMWDLDTGRELRTLKGHYDAVLGVAPSKLAISEGAVASALDAVQVFGGRGYQVEHGIEASLRDTVPATIFSGTSDIQRMLIAAELGL